MISAKNISFSVGKKVLIAPMDFQLNTSEFCVVIGANGAGKSTLLHLLAGAALPSSGHVLMDRKPLAQWSSGELAQRRAFLQQAGSLSATFTVREVLALGRYPHHQESFSESKRLIDQAVHRFGLAHLENTIFNRLSGGEKQRVQFARVLLQVQGSHKDSDCPSVLFLDEPLNNLDIHYQTELLQEARTFVDEGKGSVIAVIHDLNLSYQFADRAVLLHKGTVLADGRVEEVFIPELLSRLFATTINHYQTASGLQYFFPEKGYQKWGEKPPNEAHFLEQFNN